MSEASAFSSFEGKPAQDAAPKDGAYQRLEQEAPPPTVAALVPEIIHLDPLTLEQIEAYFPSENAQTKNEVVASNPNAASLVATAKHTSLADPVSERRSKRRAFISAPVRVRSIDLTHDRLDDITTTLNVSRMGILLASTSAVYYRSMDVMVTFPHSKTPDALQTEQPGRVVRVTELSGGRRSVAIALGVTHNDEEFIRSSGEKVHAEMEARHITVQRDPNSLRPLVLALDAEENVRDSLKDYLTNQGYDVIAVKTAQEARQVLKQCTPSVLIAEIEGEGMPGYDICAHCKSTPRLRGIPVLLTTSSAYPSDYARPTPWVPLSAWRSRTAQSASAMSSSCWRHLRMPMTPLRRAPPILLAVTSPMGSRGKGLPRR